MTRRKFLKGIAAVASFCAAPAILSKTKPAPADVWKGVGIPASQVKPAKFYDTFKDGCIQIYTGKQPSPPYDCDGGKLIMTIKLEEKFV